MRKKVLTSILLGLACICAQSQEYEGTLWSLPFLSQPSDAVSLSLGACSLTGGSNAYAAFNNPAAAVFSEGVFDLAASAGIFQPGKSEAEQNLSLGVSGFVSERISIGIALQSAVGSQYPVCDGNGYVSSYFTPGQLRLGVSAAWKVFSFLSLGASGSFYSQDLSAQNALRGFALNASVHLHTSLLDADIAARNLFAGLGSKYPVPSEAVAGISKRWVFSDFSVKTMAEASYFIESSDIRTGIGIEAGWKDFARLRIGGNYGASSPLADFLSAGLGLGFRGVSADLAYVLSKAPFGNSFLITISYKLDKKWKSSKEEQ